MVDKVFEKKYKKAEDDAKIFVEKSIHNGLGLTDIHNTIMSRLYHKRDQSNEFQEELVEKIQAYFFEKEDTVVDNSKKDLKLFGLYTCCKCGKTIKYNLKDNILIADEPECFLDKEYSFHIKNNSGKLMLCDWPAYGKELYDYLDDKGESINSDKGCYERTKNYASKNMLHFFVGNSSPRIIKKEHDIYFQECSEEVENTEDYKGYVCTDLWWVTGIDLEQYQADLIAKFGSAILNDERYLNYIKNALIIDIEPGDYTLIYQYLKNADHQSVLFATLKKI